MSWSTADSDVQLQRRQPVNYFFNSTIGATMLGRTAFRFIVIMFVMVYAGIALGQDGLQKYFNEAALKVKATTDPSQKREILNTSFEKMSKALGKVQSSPLISKDDRAGIELFKATLQEKQDELSGLNGYERVSDEQLDAFSDYVVQDMEQATQTVTISLVAALLIIIIIILLVA
jgi:hypothetical protein